jgi:hypothetical protein
MSPFPPFFTLRRYAQLASALISSQMLLSKCALFLMEDSSSFDDSDLEDILSDDNGQLLLMIATKELEDKKKPNVRG